MKEVSEECTTWASQGTTNNLYSYIPVHGWSCKCRNERAPLRPEPRIYVRLKAAAKAGTVRRRGARSTEAAATKQKAFDAFEGPQ